MDKHVFTDKQKKLIAWAAIAIFLLLSAAVGWFIGRPLVRFASRPEEFRLWVDGHGLLGMAAYVGMVFLQVVVAVIPGEPPFREAEFDIMYGEGISRLGEMLDLGVKLDLVQKSGSWFNMGDIRLGQGRDAAKQYFRDHPDEADKLEAAIRRDFHKLMSSQSKIAAKAAGRAVDVSADDFDDED